jgi:hypothetical protein
MICELFITYEEFFVLESTIVPSLKIRLKRLLQPLFLWFFVSLTPKTLKIKEITTCGSQNFGKLKQLCNF